MVILIIFAYPILLLLMMMIIMIIINNKQKDIGVANPRPGQQLFGSLCVGLLTLFSVIAITQSSALVISLNLCWF